MISTSIDQQFLNDVRSDPTNDALRLIYADYLEDYGNRYHTMFIRHQIAKSTDSDWHGFLCLPEQPCYNCTIENQLFNHMPNWIGSLFTEEIECKGIYLRLNELDRKIGMIPEGCIGGILRKGFLEVLEIPEQMLISYGKRIIMQQPIQYIRLTNRKPWPCHITGIEEMKPKAFWIRREDGLQEHFGQSVIHEKLFDKLTLGKLDSNDFRTNSGRSIPCKARDYIDINTAYSDISQACLSYCNEKN